MVYSAGRFVVCITLCYFVLVFFSPLSIAITLLGEERANISAFRMFDRLFGFVGFPLLLMSGKGCSLWLWHSWTFLLPFLLFVALWFKVRGDLFYVLLCVILFLCVSVLLALNLPGLGKKKLILVLFVRLFDFCLFGFVGFLFLLVSGRGCGLWLWRSLGFSLTLFYYSLIVDLRVYVLVKFLFWIDVWPISWQKCPFGFLFVVFWLWCRCFNCVRLSLWCLKRRMFDVRIVSIPDHCLSFDLRPNQRSHVEPVSFTWPLLSWAVLVLKEVNQYLCKFLCQKLTSTLFWMSKWERMT